MHLERIQDAGDSKPPARPRAARPDAAAFSARAEDVRAALRAAKGGELTDRGRLQALSRLVERGEYHPSSAHVAEAVLRELLR